MTSAPARRVLVVGAGAAGSMAASFAASAGADTLLVERSTDGGRKMLLSGGGRCNVLPAHIDESRFVTDSSPNLLRKLVRTWPLAEEAASGKLFPVSNRARDVRDALLDHARRLGAQIRCNVRVSAIAPSTRGWSVSLDSTEPLSADAVIIATGGLSVPATGSDGDGLRFLASLGHAMHPTYAALTPITAEPSPYSALSGVSLTVSLTARSATRSAHGRGGFLFTHRGYSGPSVLDVSHVLVRARAEQQPARLTVQWTALGDAEWEAALQPHGTRTVLGALRAELPDRLAAVLLAVADVEPTRVLSHLRRDERLRLIETLVRGDLPWSGDEGYKKAEITGGGVALGEVHPRTMESRRHPGLFLCGEVLDAFGPIGGYNFLWAWATGRAAGLGAAS